MGIGSGDARALVDGAVKMEVSICCGIIKSSPLDSVVLQSLQLHVSAVRVR